MAASSRRKGLLGEREVARIWKRAGLEVRGLEGLGDHLVFTPRGMMFHSEVKHHDARLRMAEWLAQAKREAVAGAVPVLAFPYDDEWYAALPLESLAELAS